MHLPLKKVFLSGGKTAKKCNEFLQFGHGIICTDQASSDHILRKTKAKVSPFYIFFLSSPILDHPAALLDFSTSILAGTGWPALQNHQQGKNRLYGPTDSKLGAPRATYKLL